MAHRTLGHGGDGGAGVDAEIGGDHGAVNHVKIRITIDAILCIDDAVLGQDIQNVSGATISSRNIAFGVRRALAVWREFYGK